MNARVDPATLDVAAIEVEARIAAVDWDAVARELDAQGSARIERLLDGRAMRGARGAVR